MSLKWLILICVLATCTAKAQKPVVIAPCMKPADFYEKQKYHVKRVAIGLPFRAGKSQQKLLGISGVQSFLDERLQEAQSDLESVGKGLPIDKEFRNVDGYITVQDALTTELSKLRGRTRLTFSYVTPQLLNCDDDLKTLEVFYGVVSSEPFSYLTNVFEKRADRVTPTVVKGELISAGKLGVTPTVAYNRTRGIFGGGEASLYSKGGIIDRLDVGLTGSGSTLTGDTNMSGFHDFDSGILSHVEWNFGYDYSDVPTGATKLRNSTAVAQIFGASKSLGNSALILRFGASAEGGNRNTNLPSFAAQPDAPAASDYTAIKTYIGASWVKNRQSWKVSYGLQIGSAAHQIRSDYVKQIGDFAYSARIMPADHKPLRLDFQLTGGSISSNNGLIPVAERFLGGNADSEFIRGDNWRIRSNPYIRSFPQNSLNRIDSLTPGGKNFFSANLTLAQTIWNRPLMSYEIVDDPEILTYLSSALTNVHVGLMDTYQESLPGFSELHASLLRLVNQKDASTARIDGPLLKLRIKLQNFTFPTDATPEQIDAITAAKKGIEDNIFDDKKTTPQLAVEAVETARKTPSLTLTSVRSLIEDKAATSLLSTIIMGLPALEDALGNAGHADPDLNSIEVALKSLRDELWEHEKTVTKLYDPERVEDPVNGLDGFAPIATKLQPILEAIQKKATLELSKLPSTTDDPKIKREIAAAQLYVFHAGAALQYVQGASDTISEAKDAVAESKTSDKLANDDIATAKARLDELLIGFGPAIPPLMVRLASTLRALSGEVETRAAASTPSSDDAKQLDDYAKQLLAHAADVLSLHSELSQKAKKITLPIIEKKAMPTMLYAERSLGVVFRELNMAAISPFAIFDAARIGPQANSTRGVRYGVGGGVRFSLANLDLDVGYSINPNRRSFEKRGAVVFSLNIYELFR
jgi:hypothetical protein